MRLLALALLLLMAGCARNGSGGYTTPGFVEGRTICQTTQSGGLDCRTLGE